MRPRKRPSEAGVEAGGRPKQQPCSLSSAALLFLVLSSASLPPWHFLTSRTDLPPRSACS